MFKKLLIASNNQHKANEIKEVLKDLDIELLKLDDLDIKITVDEVGETLEENSFLKAFEIFKAANMPVIADDTGLFVDALGGKPGIHSARYAGVNATYEDNCRKLLFELKNISVENRGSEFKTVICLFIDPGKHLYFEGNCKGNIREEGKGDNGFGYDPLFIPEGFDKTFAEMDSEEKNAVSHRAKALLKLKSFLSQKK
jgi:XTP/dITP diphosphohydrolase